jgi:hypothetical protein
MVDYTQFFTPSAWGSWAPSANQGFLTQQQRQPQPAMPWQQPMMPLQQPMQPGQPGPIQSGQPQQVPGSNLAQPGAMPGMLMQRPY